jgi:hypothetical protein
VPLITNKEKGAETKILFSIKKKNDKSGIGTLGVIIVVVIVVVVLAYFGFAGLHL